MFKNTKNKIKTTQSRSKVPKINDRNLWWMVYEKITKGLIPLSRPKPSKKGQDKYDEI